MMADPCVALRDRLPELVSDVLPPLEAAMLEEHLGSCHECLAERRILESARSGKAPAPPHLTARVLAQLDRPAPAAARTSPRVSSSWWHGRALLAAAGLVAVILAGVILRGEGAVPLEELLANESVETPELGALPGGEGLMAGAPVLAELTEEELEVLLEELET